MRDFTKLALEKAQQAGAAYADIRLITATAENINVRRGHVQAVNASTEQGFGIRALYDGAWGFASSAQLNSQEVSRIAQQAVAIAKASAQVKQEDVVLSPADPVEGSFATKVRKDPFDIKLEDKIELLLEADRRLQVDSCIRVTTAGMKAFNENKIFANTEGSYVEQNLTHCGAGMSAISARNGEIQKRSYPGQFGGDYAAQGYEFIESLDLPGQAERVGQEAKELLTAAPCPDGPQTIILEGSQLALQIHESCGHPIELDRVMGEEAGYAGTSFLTPDKLGHYRYGSPHVNITADATIPGALGSFGWDDEGVPAQSTPVVRDGIFVGYLSSRQHAHKLGQLSSGAMRAVSWNKIPLVRMTNVNLEPGDWTVEEIIKDTKQGIYLDLNKSFSIDDRRLNFQFGTEVAWEIKDGAIGQMLKNPVYSGITPEFWNACDAVAGRGKNEWKVWGIPNCGKGEPGQPCWVGHGAAPARFRNIKVGVNQ